ncbi:uncharacterized protein SAPINGB_P005177 [Magnusiomyces paraingens]|uniref:Restriction of telomere capping protein 1 n=1 Tax=Magnusiomyces paraingens TaxID=2606893 RepID=A0A5E8BZS3_9ASCO|nr:uncharacterized protein SAPINGB_P005177 [Saprochaete ingens]VVT56612.1 unnamed protein product [Saprochaete ingens]
MANGPYDHSTLYDDIHRIFTSPASRPASNPSTENIAFSYGSAAPNLTHHMDPDHPPARISRDHSVLGLPQELQSPYHPRTSTDLSTTSSSVPPVSVPAPRDTYANRAAKATGGALARFGKVIIGANSSSSNNNNNNNDYENERAPYSESAVSSGRNSDPPSRDNSISGSFTGYASFGHQNPQIQRSLSTAPGSSRPLLSRANSASIVNQFSTSSSPRQLRYMETKKKDFRYYARNEILAMGPSATEHAVAIAGKDFFQILRIDNDSATAAQDIRSIQDSRNRDFDKLHNVTDLSWGRQEYRHTIALSTSGGQILVYNIDKQSPKPVSRINDSNRTINSICFHPYYGYNLVSAGGDGSVKIWDLRQSKRKPAISFLKSGDVVREVQCSPFDNNKYAAIYDSGAVMRWDSRYPRLVDRRINAHSGSGLSFDWHPEYDYIVTGGIDRQIQIWYMNSENRNPDLVIQHPAPVAKVRWQHDILNSTASSKYGVLNTDIACCNMSLYDNGIYIWNPRRPHIPHYILEPHTKAVTDVFWRSQSTLWSISRDKTFSQTVLDPSHMTIKRLNSQAFSWSQGDTFSFVAQDRYEELYDKDPGHELPAGAGGTNVSAAALTAAATAAAVAAASEDDRRRGSSSNLSVSATGSRKPLPPVPAPPSTKQYQAVYSMSFPGGSSESFQFCAENYLYYDSTPSLNALRKSTTDPAIDINTTTGMRAVQICEYNAKAAALAGKFRTSQTWYMLQEVIGQERVDFLKQYNKNLINTGNHSGSLLQPYASRILESLKSVEVSPLALPADDSSLKITRELSLDKFRKGSTVSSLSGLRNSDNQQTLSIAATMALVGGPISALADTSNLAPILSSEDSSFQDHTYTKDDIISSGESSSSPTSAQRRTSVPFTTASSPAYIHKKASSNASSEFPLYFDQLSQDRDWNRKNPKMYPRNHTSSPRMPYMSNSESMGDLTAMYSSRHDPKFRRFRRRDTHDGILTPQEPAKRPLTTYNNGAQSDSESESVNDSSSASRGDDDDEVKSAPAGRASNIEQYDIERAMLAYASYESEASDRPRNGSEGSTIQRSANKSTNSARESSDKPDLSSDEDEISSGYESRNEESGYPKDTFDSSENDALSSSDVGSYESEDESSSIEAEPIRRITSNATNKTTNSLLSRPSMKQRRLSQGSSHYSVHSKHSLYSHRRLHGFNMAHYLNHKTRMHPILNTHHIRPYLHHHIHHAKSKNQKPGTPLEGMAHAVTVPDLTKLYRIYQRKLQHPWKAENMVAQAAWYAISQGDIQLAATLGMLFLRDYPGAFHHKNSEGFEFEFGDLEEHNDLAPPDVRLSPRSGVPSSDPYYDHVGDAFDDEKEKGLCEEGEQVVEEWVHTYLQDLRKHEQHVVAAEIIKLSPFDTVRQRGQIETAMDSVCHRCAAPLSENGAAAQAEMLDMELRGVALEQRLPTLVDEVRQYTDEEEDEDDDEDSDKRLMGEIVARYTRSEREYQQVHGHGDRHHSHQQEKGLKGAVFSPAPGSSSAVEGVPPRVEFWYCSSCQELLDGCAYCRLPVKSLGVSFFECGHKVHAQCLQDWARECGDIPDPTEIKEPPPENVSVIAAPRGGALGAPFGATPNQGLARSHTSVYGPNGAPLLGAPSAQTPMSSAVAASSAGSSSAASAAAAAAAAASAAAATAAANNGNGQYNFQRSYSATYMPSSWFPSSSSRQPAPPAPSQQLSASPVVAPAAPMPGIQSAQSSPKMMHQRLFGGSIGAASTPSPAMKTTFRPALECPTGCGAVLVI